MDRDPDYYLGLDKLNKDCDDSDRLKILFDCYSHELSKLKE